MGSSIYIFRIARSSLYVVSSFGFCDSTPILFKVQISKTQNNSTHAMARALGGEIQLGKYNLVLCGCNRLESSWAPEQQTNIKPMRSPIYSLDLHCSSPTQMFRFNVTGSLPMEIFLSNSLNPDRYKKILYLIPKTSVLEWYAMEN